MRQLLLTIILLVGTLAYTQQSIAQSLPNRQKVQKAYQLVQAEKAEANAASHIIKVVYFHGNDQEPLAKWQERLPRTLEAVSIFYQEEFQKHGIVIEGIPFEKENGEYVIHRVQGDQSAHNYEPTSGVTIEREIANKTQGKINPSRDYILVINGLCYQKEDGTYVFHAPYHGRGSFQSGVCHVADCELLDALLLTDTTQRMQYSEMAVALKECSVAEFNSWYVGGIAHELGHLFGLPHDFGHPQEIDANTISLMGQYGSRHFKDYLWGGTPTSRFSTAGIMQLMGHPLFTQIAKVRKTDFQFPKLTFNKNEAGVVLKASLNTSYKPYAIITLISHTRPGADYFAQSASEVIETESFSVELGQIPSGTYNLELIYAFPNGETHRIKDILIVEEDNASTSATIHN